MRKQRRRHPEAASRGKPRIPSGIWRPDPNQGEGDRISARSYNEHTREFVESGAVPAAAEAAKRAVERDPDGALRDERHARHAPASGRLPRLREIVVEGSHRVSHLLERIRTFASSARRRHN